MRSNFGDAVLSEAFKSLFDASIGKSSWLRELENISVGHGVSLLCWRSGGVEHPHDTPPYPFTPSPTFAHSSIPRPSLLTAPPRRESTIRDKSSAYTPTVPAASTASFTAEAHTPTFPTIPTGSRRSRWASTMKV